MSEGMNWLVILLAVANVVGCVWLLIATARSRPEDKDATATTGHAWDGDLVEYNKPLPRWWLWLFLGTVAFAVVYLVLYPGFGRYEGTLGWNQYKDHDRDAAVAEEKAQAILSRFRDRPLPQLAGDLEAQAIGRNVFANNCATCHGSDARGNPGFPNLADNDWIWGGAPEQVLTTIREGRIAAMPPLGAALGEAGVNEVVNYVRSLSDLPHDARAAEAGSARFATLCVACHGPTGTGNPILGAPNLTDDIWLYGSDAGTIAQTINYGRNGQMPAHGPILGEDRVRLVAAYVLHLSGASDDSQGGSR
ncbi:MAG: cytochrome-c oxidase, cbb3-type subunit III [Xanthomonadales bacterium]|nr:cytochrome-c oxidase, cbb3-type subunit III [Xanthomonadales bacterium]